MTADLSIERFAYTPMGVFGRCYIAGQELFTVERPWLNNARSISCIPEGVYTCVPRFYNKGGYESIEITNVPNRSNVLIHKGNTMHDLAGCIAVTAKLGSVHGIWGGINSKAAFAILMEHYGDRQFVLEIVRYVPQGMPVPAPARVPRLRSAHNRTTPRRSNGNKAT
jgi:hypothetical protein